MIYTSTIGFPRIGEKRELKKIVESYWKNQIPAGELKSEVLELKKVNLLLQKEKGIDLIPSGDFSLYDTVLDHSIMLGQIPEKYLEFGNPTSLDVYFAMARGKGKAPALEMTKWFDTNYHYIVPELSEEFKLTENRALNEYTWAKQELGIETKPVILGPYTFLKLCKLKNHSAFKENLKKLRAPYSEILEGLSRANVKYIQIDEPAFVLGQDPELIKLVGEIYKEIAFHKGKSNWILQTYFEDLEEHFSSVLRMPFDYIGLDLVRGTGNLQILEENGIPEDKKLALGVLDGRNVWKSKLDDVLRLLLRLKDRNLLNEAIIQPSASLMHLPYTVKTEKAIPKQTARCLCFAVERLEELSLLKQHFLSGKPANEKNPSDFNVIKDAARPKVRDRLAKIEENHFKRDKTFAERKAIQNRRLGLPMLATTTIGSFPQTDEVRKTRAKWKSSKISGKEYNKFIKKEIREAIRLQEQIGLDVLVHGEFERSDMVEFFGERLKGFLFTKGGWVQSYGTRCVKPPIIYGDVERTRPMTVDTSVYAQSLTSKPVKGMLTGPTTIINWSFPRNDIPREEIACQIALALRDETVDLEKKGIKIIQIDEPALREGLPMKGVKKRDYLRGTVRAFRLCSGGVKSETQIHTHMCYSDFNEIIRTIYDLDADVISIENARSSDELLSVFKEFNYDHYIGPGVYDVHSERIPSVEEILDKIKKISNHIRKDLLWINPDCGLKTRQYEETIPSLKNMVEAATRAREGLSNQ